MLNNLEFLHKNLSIPLNCILSLQQRLDNDFEYVSLADESLMCIIEMIQFKMRILFVIGRDDPDQKESISRSVRREFTEHFLELSHECPGSSIVYQHHSPNFKKVALKLYQKYVQKPGVFEVNVEWETRKFLTDLMQNKEWCHNEEYRDLRDL